MEQNAPIKLFVLTLTILSAINLTSCRTNKNTTASIEHNGSSETSYSNMELINSKLAALDSLGCGKTNSTLNSLSHMLVYNGDVFDCLKREQKDSVLLRKVLYEITLLVDFEASVSYINFLPAIRNYNDSEIFFIVYRVIKARLASSKSRIGLCRLCTCLSIHQ